MTLMVKLSYGQIAGFLFAIFAKQARVEKRVMV